MAIFKCNECGALMSPDIVTDGWYFNGDCWQHNCDGVLKIATEHGRVCDYHYASEKLSEKSILERLSRG